MPNIKIEIDDRGVVDALNRVLAAGEELHPVLNAIGRQIKTNVQLGFHSGTDPYGRPWAPLRSRRGQPLRDRGHLMDSIDYQLEADSVVIGTNLVYAPVHQFGATIEAKRARALHFFVEGKPVFVGRGRKVTIPARPMLPTEGLPEPWRQDLINVVGDILARLWRGQT